MQTQNKILETSVFPGMFLEIKFAAFEKYFHANCVYQLIQKHCSFAIRDAVKQVLSNFVVFARSLYGMGWRQTVVDQWTLLFKWKCKPNIFRIYVVVNIGLFCGKLWQIHILIGNFDFFASNITNKTGKALIEPNIVPPLHSDHVSKPLMGQLMLHYHMEEYPVTFRQFIQCLRNKIALSISDTASTFHSSVAHIWTNYMVQLFKWKLHTKQLILIILYSLFNEDAYQMQFCVLVLADSVEDSLRRRIIEDWLVVVNLKITGIYRE